MAQTERVSVLTLIYDRRLNKPMVQDKSVICKLNVLPRGKHAGRLSPNSTQLNRILYFQAN